MKTLLITGATDGIGKQMSLDSAKNDYRLVLHGKDKKRLDELQKDILKINGRAEVSLLEADFTNMKQTAEEFKQYEEQYGMPEILINNAGVLSNEKKITDNGFEMIFQVNHLAPFLLTNILTQNCKFQKEHRIINVSSMIHANELDFENLNSEKSFSPNAAYSSSKLCNILFTNKLVRKFSGTKFISASVHPGVIDTKLLRQQWGGGVPVSEGAENVLYTIDAEVLKYLPGAYILNKRPMEPAPVANDESVQDKLWNTSLEMVNPFLK